MSARDELRGTLANTICNAMLYPPKAVPHLLGGDMGKVLDKTADAILAAGYRKPRTVTTQEELDALPNETVVLDADSVAGQKAFAGVWTSGGEMLVSELMALPVTVLWEPEA